MPRSLNSVHLLGHLGGDAETKHTTSGVAVSNFSMATSRRVKRGEEWTDETDWHRVVAWRVENLAPYLTKGKAVFVAGRLQTRKYEKNGETRYATEVVAEEIILLGGKDAEDGGRPAGGDRLASAPRGYSGTNAPARDAFPSGITDDDVPF